MRQDNVPARNVIAKGIEARAQQAFRRDFTLAFSPSGQPRLAYATYERDTLEQPVAYAECNSACDMVDSWSKVVLADTASASVTHFAVFTLSVGGNGRPRLALCTGTGGSLAPNTLYYLACDAAACAQDNSRTRRRLWYIHRYKADSLHTVRRSVRLGKRVVHRGSEAVDNICIPAYRKPECRWRIQIRQLTPEVFAQWMEEYGRASADNDPEASAALFAEEASYYESPIDEPIVGRAAIYRYWAAGAQNLTEKSSSYEILALRDNVGVARWQSHFVVASTGAAVALDCIFVVEFDEQGRCSLFREWWHLHKSPQRLR